MTITGTDVSVWQDNNTTPNIKIDFNTMRKAGARFCFIKAIQGVRIDQDFADYWRDAKAAGIPRGAYLFLDWNVSARKQAEAYWALLKDDPGEFIHPIIDFEGWNNPPPTALSLLRQVCTEVESVTGRIPMIYTSAGFFNEFGRGWDTAWKRYPLWIANYTTASVPLVPKPWGKSDWLFWQYTSKGDGKLYGVESATVDLNRFNGDEAAFRKVFIMGESVTPVMPPDALDRLWAAHPELWPDVA